MKRLFALLLCAALLLTVFPVSAFAAKTELEEEPLYVYTEADNARLDADVFSAIEAVKADAAEVCGGIGKMTEQDYIDLVPQVIEAVKASATYVPGTLQANGNFLVWETTVGIPCCYDPRMEAELHNTENDPTPEEIAWAEAQAEAILQSVDEICGGGPYTPDIGLIQPYWESSSNYADSSFNNYSPQYKAMWQALYETTGGSGMRYSMSNATVDNIGATMSQCGLVMFDSHGTTDYSGSGGDYTSRANSSYLCLTTNAGVTSEDTASHTGAYGTYYDCIKGSGYAYVNGQCIANHMPTDAPNSYLYMGICLGMATDRMCVPLRDKGVEVVYGYSQSVTFAGDMDYMNNLNTNIKNGDDMGTAVAKMKAAVGVPDPYTSSYPAWPVVASSEDPYPGHGNVDRAQTVYSTWSLFGTNYEVTASSNNEEWGTVEVRGSQIIAYPAEGYYAAGYELLSGTATITQNGNRFLVQAESDCSVQINFAAKTPAVVNYYANGQALSSVNTYLADDVILPAAAPAEYGYKFIGWTEEIIPETNMRPDYYKPGASYTVMSSSVNLYALYSCRFGTGGYVYELVVEDPDDWEGKYVITSGTDENMYVLAGVDGGTNYEYTSSAAATFASTGMSLDENELSDVDDLYVFEVSSVSGGKFSIQNKQKSSYVASINGYLNAVASYSSSSCNWSLDYTDYGTMMLKNDASSSYPYMVKGSSAFILSSSYTSAHMQLWQYTEAGEIFYYTFVSEHEHELVHVEAAAPTCTENGCIEHWRCALCGKCFSDAAAENEIPAASVVIAATGHTPADPVTENQTEPTCGADGGYDTVVYCAVCGAQISRTHIVIPATGEHEYGEWSANNDKTHSRVCAVCQGVETEACSFTDEVTPPTPADQGYTTHTCTVCGYSYDDSFVPALGFDYTVHFSVPEGVEQPDDMVSNTNTGITLPTVAAPDGYTFLGWVTDTYNNVTDKPGEILTGHYVAPGEITLNALFVQYVGGEASYVLLTAAPADWTGNYLITYGADAAYVMKGIAAGLSYEEHKNGGAAPLADTGMVLNGDTLVNVPLDYVFAAEAHGTAYSFRSVAMGTYLADRMQTSSYVLRAAETYEDDCAWKLSVASNGVVTMKSQLADANPAIVSFYKHATRPIYYFKVASSADQIRLWKEVNTGTPYYTTVIGEEPEPDPVDVYFVDQDGNANAYAYAFGSGVENAPFPGEALTAVGVDENGDNYYKITLDRNVYTNVIFSGGDNTTQTADLGLGDGEYIIYYVNNRTGYVGSDIWPEPPVKIEPTCTEAGSVTYTGMFTGEEHVTEIEALGHDYAAVVTEPTCTEGGFTTYTCSRCGDTYTDSETEALGHAWDEGVVTTEPTEEAPGVLTYSCTRCGETKTEEIPALEHDCKITHFADVMEKYPYGTPEHEAIEWAFTHDPQITSGMNETTFGVGGTLTRAQAATFLYAAAGKPEFDETTAENPFKDVKPGKWYTTPVLWAYSKGLVSGMTADTYGVNGTLTRGQIMVILYAWAGKPSVEGMENPYTDVPAGKWFTNAAIWAANEGIENGTDGKFVQSTLCVRESMVLYLYRYLEHKCLTNE